MFTFHRPKIYRSTHGCCICGAKSSSSRFTDSARYETEFQSCFNLEVDDHRAGEICNACVLLIKRWKKLPKGTQRNWNHVVDARAGPGGKSQLRSKLRHRLFPQSSSHSSINSTTTSNSNNNNNNNTFNLASRSLAQSRRQSHYPGSFLDSVKKHKHRSPRAQRLRRMRLYSMKLRNSDDSSCIGPPLSPGHSDGSDSIVRSPKKKPNLPEVPPALKAIVDTTYWKREKVCCGTIFKGLHGEVLIHPQLLRPCANSCLLRSTSNLAAVPLEKPRSDRQDSLGSDGSGEISELDDSEPMFGPNPHSEIKSE